MSKTILLQKATRIEGNANIHIETEDGRIRAARFMVHEFRGFESFLKGRRVEYVPQLVSRICGLCSVAHQVACINALEDALGIEAAPAVRALRETAVLGEWISSHALSYFFLTMPDQVGSERGVFGLMDQYPEIISEAFELRQAGLEIARLIGKRAMHPVALGVGRFLMAPTNEEIDRIRGVAGWVRDKAAEFIVKLEKAYPSRQRITFPEDIGVNFVAYDSGSDSGQFKVFDRTGGLSALFGRDEFDENIAEMRADWSLAKIPYLHRLGFPEGIMLVGPLSRSFLDGGFLNDPEVLSFQFSQQLLDRTRLSFDSYDVCRLLEIFWAAKRILMLLEPIDAPPIDREPNLEASGQGIGVLEAPRGVLMHKYLINQGIVESCRLLVATQFNNAYINLSITDLAQKHVNHAGLSSEGERLIGRCIRLLDPCLSCATH